MASTSPAITDIQNKFQCPGKELHPVHSPCAGAKTKRTEHYTPDMADATHSAMQEEAPSQRATAAMASVPQVRGECDDAEDEMIGRLDPTYWASGETRTRGILVYDDHQDSSA